MKSYKLISIILLPLFLLFISCQLEEPDVKETKTDTGSQDFSKYVAIGNSLTAGYQSGSLVEEHQQFSFPNLIAQQLGIDDFQQPTISWPGLPSIMTLESVTGVLGTASGTGAPTNLTLAGPYDNMGIPGIVLADVNNATSTTNSFSHSRLIDPILRGLGTQLAQALSLSPTLISCWIGNNDVLGYATSGGTSPAAPTDVPTFTALYAQLAADLAGSGAKVVVANIPDVTSIPFFKTAGPLIAQSLNAKGVTVPFRFEKGSDDLSTGIATGTATITELASFNVLVTLLGASYTSEIGSPSGKWYRDLAAKLDPPVPVSALLATMPMVDTTQVFGLHPQNPWPSALVLDEDEIVVAQTAIDNFNDVIAAQVTANGFALFDANAFLADVAVNGYDPGAGLPVLTADYITGGLFSLDGVHPSNMGYAVVANEIIDALNDEFDTDIQKVNLRDISGNSPVASEVNFKEFNLKLMSKTVQLFGADIR